MKYFDLKKISIDENFTKLYDIDVVNGRTFNANKKTDFNNCLLNEAAVKKLGLGNNVCNKRIKVSGRDEGIIIGVVKDFYFSSKHNEIEPLILSLKEESKYSLLLSVKVAPGSLKQTIHNIQDEWNNFSSNEKLNYTLAEHKIEEFYRSEERLNTIFKWGTVLSFSIVCFGLICFVLFIIEQKSKDISIRKVNGASTFWIIKNVLFKEYFIPCIISFTIVLPISYLIIGNILKTIVTEVTIGWWIYISTIIVILLTLLITTISQLYKAANKNPIEALRNE
jgi:putative ABC transport system permease protein